MDKEPWIILAIKNRPVLIERGVIRSALLELGILIAESFRNPYQIGLALGSFLGPPIATFIARRLSKST